MSSCALCQEERSLQNSHIIPEFLHKSTYDEKHKTLQVEQDVRKPNLIQKGLRERLLCADCEAILQEYEDYFARAWRKAVPARVNQPSLNLSLDYRKTKLFILSVVWRAAVAQSAQFRKASLGPHAEPLRRMIHSGEAGPSALYPVYGHLLVDPTTGEVWDDAIHYPIKIRINGVWCHNAMFASVVWTVSTSGRPIPQFEGCRLSDSGEMNLPCLSWKQWAESTGLVETALRIEI